MTVFYLALIGGAVSIYLSKAVLYGIVWAYVENLPPELKQIQLQVGIEDNPVAHFDSGLIAVTFCLALIASLAAAIAPALRACTRPPAEHLKV